MTHGPQFSLGWSGKACGREAFLSIEECPSPTILIRFNALCETDRAPIAP